MRSTNIVSLSDNDGWQLAAKKINENFKNLYAVLSTDSNTQNIVTNVSVDNRISDTEAKTDRWLKDFRNDIDTLLEEFKKEMAPAVGSFLYAKYDPNTKWPDTKWTQVDEGYFLVSSGNKYVSGRKYGSDAYVAKGYGLQTQTTGTYANKVLVTDDTGQSGFNVPKSIAVPLWERVE